LLGCWGAFSAGGWPSNPALQVHHGPGAERDGGIGRDRAFARFRGERLGIVASQGLAFCAFDRSGTRLQTFSTCPKQPDAAHGKGPTTARKHGSRPDHKRRLSRQASDRARIKRPSRSLRSAGCVALAGLANLGSPGQHVPQRAIGIRRRICVIAGTYNSPNL
jgi:hypothetical protein